MRSSATSSVADSDGPCAWQASPHVDELHGGPEEWVGQFSCMASPCEVLVSGTDRATSARVLEAVACEARRIEARYSRFRTDNVVHRINAADGRAVCLDEETTKLLRYAGVLHALSGGLFDVTSGVLRRAWRFDGSDRVPTARQVRALLDKVGWHRVRFEPPWLTMEPGMEIDLGGLGKEYAVDRAAALARALHPHCLVNFGGDLLAVGPRADGRPWRVGIERVDGRDTCDVPLDLAVGALATSGDARRYLLKDGVRYGHVLDPRTGWPVRRAPRSVTVAAPTCTQAGMLATFALLQGPDAERFLAAQHVDHWCRR